MRIQTYFIAITLLSTIAASLSFGNSMVYASDDENDPCYEAGYEAGRSGSFNRTQQSGCGTTGQA
jgi:hypothetical protein